MVLTFEGTTQTEIGNFYVNEHGVLIGLLVRKDEENNNFSVCLSGEVSLKLPFQCNHSDVHPFYFDYTTGLISLFSSVEDASNNQPIGFLYGCKLDEDGALIPTQVGENHKAFLRI